MYDDTEDEEKEEEPQPLTPPVILVPDNFFSLRIGRWAKKQPFLLIMSQMHK